MKGGGSARGLVTSELGRAEAGYCQRYKNSEILRRRGEKMFAYHWKSPRDGGKKKDQKKGRAEWVHGEEHG